MCKLKSQFLKQKKLYIHVTRVYTLSNIIFKHGGIIMPGPINEGSSPLVNLGPKYHVSFEGGMNGFGKQKMDGDWIFGGIQLGANVTNTETNFGGSLYVNTSGASTNVEAAAKQYIPVGDHVYLTGSAAVGANFDNLNTVKVGTVNGEQRAVDVKPNPEIYGTVGMEATYRPTETTMITGGVYGTLAVDGNPQTYTTLKNGTPLDNPITFGGGRREDGTSYSAFRPEIGLSVEQRLGNTPVNAKFGLRVDPTGSSNSEKMGPITQAQVGISVDF